MRITPLGFREVGLASLLAAAAIALAVGGVANGAAWILLPAAVPVIFWLWVVWFFRDPRRIPPQEPNLLISPADGRISDITPLGDDSPLAGPACRIGIFMNVFSVHVNRAPCNGVVESVDHQPGCFFDARRDEAIDQNESTTLRLRHTPGEDGVSILVRQVAGKIARRIVTTPRPGDSLQRGQRYGMIKFGSRLEVTIPEQSLHAIRVQIGQSVRAGESILAELRETTA